MRDHAADKAAILAWLRTAESPNLCGAARHIGSSRRHIHYLRETDPEFLAALNKVMVDVGCDPYPGEDPDHVERREQALDCFLDAYAASPRLGMAEAIAATRAAGHAICLSLVSRQRRVNAEFREALELAEEARMDAIRTVAMTAAMDPTCKGYSAALRTVFPVYSRDAREADQARRGVTVLLPGAEPTRGELHRAFIEAKVESRRLHGGNGRELKPARAELVE